jgi:thiamine biosynthesis lipoprotein ApbE
MNITIAPEHIYMFVSLFLTVMQIYQFKQQERLKKEIDKLWDQISTFNTMVALKLLETQKELAKLNENKKD